MQPVMKVRTQRLLLKGSVRRC